MLVGMAPKQLARATTASGFEQTKLVYLWYASLAQEWAG